MSARRAALLWLLLAVLAGVAAAPTLGAFSARARQATPPVGIAGILGAGSQTLVQCNRSGLKVYRAADPSKLDSLFENFANTAPDTLKLFLVLTGGWDTTLEYTGNANCLHVANQVAQGDGAGYRRNDRIIRFSGTAQRDIAFVGGTFANNAFDNETSTPPVSFDDGERIIFAQTQWLFGREKTGVVLSPLATSDTIKDWTYWRNLHALCATEPTSVAFSTADAGGHVTQIDQGHNAYHSCSHRNPFYSTGSNSSTNVENRIGRSYANHSYNGRQAGGIQIGGWYLDVVDGYTLGGPWSLTGPLPGSQDYSWVVSIMCADPWGSTDADSTSSVYVDRLVGEHNSDPATVRDSLVADGGAFQEVACYYTTHTANGGGDPFGAPYSLTLRDTIATDPTYPLPRLSPDLLTDELYGATAGNEGVGDYRRISCAGEWALRADSILAALAVEVRDTTGISVNVDSTFVEQRQGYTKPAGTACTDDDGDGMPNAYEVRIQGGTDSTGAVVTGDPDGDGWTNIEEFVQGTDPTVETDENGNEGAITATHFPGTDTAFSTYRLLRTDQVNDNGDTFSWPHPDTIPVVITNGRFPIVHDDCTVGDTILVSTLDTLAAGAKAPMTQSEIDSWNSTHGLSSCSSTNLRDRKVPGGLSSDLPPSLLRYVRSHEEAPKPEQPIRWAA